MPPESGAPRLLTLAASHYCEKARWALDRAGIAFEEECHAPGIHRMIVARHRAGITVPILFIGGRKIGGSSAILHHIDTLVGPELRLYPEDQAARGEVEELERLFDEDLGPASRLIAYRAMQSHPDMLVTLMDHDLPRGERFALRKLTPGVSAIIKTALGVNEKNAQRSMARVAEIFAEVGERLADGRPYLTGERFTAADLSFAALGAPITWPENYGSWLPSVDDAPPEMAEPVRMLRATPAGTFALRMFEQERPRVAEKLPA
jgi:glutathione S-transferase